MKYPLKDKVILLTGASSGIGAGLAVELGRRGARLALGSRNLEACRKTADLARRAGAAEVLALRLDVEDTRSCETFVKMATKAYDRVDGLVNNAGTHLIAAVEDLPEDLLLKALQVNLFGPLRLIKAVLPQMKAQKSGLIVQVSSVLGTRALSGVGGYSATKGALNRLTEALRMELGGSGVRVLNVVPGVVPTELRQNSLHVGPPPQKSGLPYPRSVEITCREIADAMEDGRRELWTCAWQVKAGMKWISLLFPSLFDRSTPRVNPTTR